MFKMQNDMVRQHTFDSASKDARKTGAISTHSIVEQAAMMRDKPMPVKRRKIPWFLIISVATSIPFMFNGNGTEALMSAVPIDDAKKAQMIEVLDTVEVDEANPIKFSFEMNGKQYHKEITASEIESAKQHLRNR